MGALLTENERSYGIAFCVSFLLGTLYYLLHLVPIPTVDDVIPWNSNLYGKYIHEINVCVLGLKPVLSGFIVLEVLSLILPPLTRWRSQGTEGREKLNLWAWRLTFLFTFIQALGTTYLFKSIMGSSIKGSFLGFQVITIAALMGGTALAVFLARLITRFGIGNGFLILVMSTVMPYLLAMTAGDFKGYLATQPSGDQNFKVLGIAVGFAVFTYFLWRFLHRPPRFPFRTSRRSLAWFEVPCFPFGASLQDFVLTCIGSIGAFLSSFQLPREWMSQGWPHLGMELALMAPLGVLFYHWFWGIDQFGLQVADMPRLLEKREKFLDRNFRRSFGFLLLGVALFWVPVGPERFRALYWIVNLYDLIWYFGLFRDLWDEWKFWRIHGRGEELMELDNMILASYLKGLLEAEKIPCHFQGFHFRMLMLWLKPLFKVRLLVPAGQVERAKSLIAQVPYQVG